MLSAGSVGRSPNPKIWGVSSVKPSLRSFAYVSVWVLSDSCKIAEEVMRCHIILRALAYSLTTELEYAVGVAAIAGPGRMLAQTAAQSYPRDAAV